MKGELTLDGIVKKSSVKMDWIEDPEKILQRVYVSLANLEVTIDGEDRRIEQIRDNPHFEAGDMVRLHIYVMDIVGDKAEQDMTSFKGWFKKQKNLFPFKIEKIKDGKIVYEFSLPYNTTTYVKDGYCPMD